MYPRTRARQGQREGGRLRAIAEQGEEAGGGKSAPPRTQGKGGGRPATPKGRRPNALFLQSGLPKPASARWSQRCICTPRPRGRPEWQDHESPGKWPESACALCGQSASDVHRANAGAFVIAGFGLSDEGRPGAPGAGPMRL